MLMTLGMILSFAIAMVSTGPTLVAAQATPAATPAATPIVANTGLAGATAWLVSQQGEDGSFLGFSGEPDAGTTVDALLALVAADNAGIDTSAAIDAAIGYLGSEDIALVYTQTGVGQAAKLVLGLVAAGEDPTDFAGVDPLVILEHGQDADTGIYGGGLFNHALVVLALAATDSEIPTSAIDALAASQAPNGGWGWDGSPVDDNADSNTTSLVIQALVAAGQGDSELVTNGIAYLQTTIVDGGAAYNHVEGSTADANSTAYVIQAFIAAGQDASALQGDLAAFQNADGSYVYNAETPGANLLAVVQAIPAVAEQAFPIVPADAAAFAPVTFALAA